MGKRSKYLLSMIHTKYVLVLLADFFLQSSLDCNYIEQLMDKNHNIASFTFGETKDADNKVFEPFPDFHERPVHSEYKYNLKADI